jgi:uracil-DNA glycosylase
MSNWHPKSCEGCSLYGVGRGFCLDAGDPLATNIAIVLESPYLEEVNFSVWPPPGNKKRYVLGEVRESQAEMKRRRERYPEIEPRLLARGVPVVGRTGFLFNQMLEAAGIQRDRIFIGNTLRCIAPKSKGGANWPTGNAKNIAAFACRKYDRIDEFKPTVVVFSIHPSAVLREQTPYLLIVEDLRKVKEFADQGERVLLLMGGNAVDTYFGFFKNVTKSRGHYEFVDSKWLTARTEYLRIKAEKARRLEVPKELRPKKKSKSQVARAELAAKVLDAAFPFLRNHGTCCCGSSFVDRDAIIAELTGRVVAALTPPPRPKKPAAVAPSTPSTPATSTPVHRFVNDAASNVKPEQKGHFEYGNSWIPD